MYIIIIIRCITCCREFCVCFEGGWKHNLWCCHKKYILLCWLEQHFALRIDKKKVLALFLFFFCLLILRKHSNYNALKMGCVNPTDHAFSGILHTFWNVYSTKINSPPPPQKRGDNHIYFFYDLYTELRTSGVLSMVSKDTLVMSD